MNYLFLAQEVSSEPLPRSDRQISAGDPTVSQPAAAGEATRPPQQAPSLLGMIWPLLFFFAIMYFLMIRPQQRKHKQHQQLLSAIKKGDAVISSGGIHGVVDHIKDNIVFVKISEGVRIPFEKNSIATRIPQGGENSEKTK